MGIKKEIDFVRSGKIDIPVAIYIDRQSESDFDYDTATQTVKYYGVKMFIELEGEVHEFSFKLSENWVYINEGEGVGVELLRVSNFNLNCVTLSDSFEVEYIDLYELELDDDTKSSNDRKNVRFRSNVVGRGRESNQRDGYCYNLIEPSCRLNVDDKEKHKRIFEMALDTYVGAVTSKEYVPSWTKFDSWKYNEDVIDRFRDTVNKLEQSPNYCYASANITVSSIHLNKPSLDLYRNHLALNHADLDFNIIDSLVNFKSDVYKNLESKKSANDICFKLYNILSKYDRETSSDILNYLSSLNNINKAVSFIERSHQRIFEIRESELSIA